MGMMLFEYYKYILKEKGLEGRAELARRTKISSIIAPLTPDSPENIRIFKLAIKEITGKESPEFGISGNDPYV
jgi:hypothetical protein